MKKYPSIDSNRISERAFYSTTLVELLRWRALHQPRTVGYTFLADGESEEINLTYEELDRQARAVGNLLAGLNASGERALLVYPPGLEFIAGFFGCLYAGVVAVPVYPPDPARLNRTLPRLQAIVADARAKIVLTTSPILSMAQAMFRQIPELKELRWLSHDAATAGSVDDWQEPDVNQDALAFLQYTSGSTGAPKGVMLSHCNLLHNAKLVYQAVEHSLGDKYVSWLPMFHDMGFMAGVLQPVYAGIPAVLMSPMSFLQRPARWLQAICHYKATTSGGPNFAYDLCARKITAEQRATLDLSNWSVAFNGAEPIRAESLERFIRAFESCGFRRETFYPCYGLAEATLMVSGSLKSAPPIVKTLQVGPLEKNKVVDAQEHDEGTQSITGCGRTLLGQEIVIVDPESFIECPRNQIGEIWVSGPSVAQGYWMRPEETEQTFRATLQGDNRRCFLRTGDLGFLQDGELYVTGRLKDLIIVRGLNHYPQDIEFTVEKSHPSLRPGCGAAFSTQVAGAEHLIVVQEIDLSNNPDLDLAIDSIRQGVSESHDLQAYGVVLLRAGSIPKTSSGKVQRHACRAGYLESTLEEVKRSILEDGDPDEIAAGLNAEAIFDSPRDERLRLLESYLRQRVGRALRMAPSLIDQRMPLTALGIDSLTAVELRNQTEAGLNVQLALTKFLQGSSISDLAAEILGLLDGSSHAPLIHLPASEESTTKHPLSQIQQSLWFFSQLSPESAGYNNAFAARIFSEVDADALKRAFQALVVRHPCLRTIYLSDEGRPVQIVLAHQEVAFESIDCSLFEPEDLKQRLEEEAYRPFDLERGPVIRVRLFTQSAKEHVLLLVVHHIAMDGWSFWNLIDELRALYPAQKNGTQPILPSLPLQYTDYVRWQAEMLGGPQGERLWSYWAKELAGELPVLNLPTDRPRPPAQTYRGDAHQFKLSDSLTSHLKALADAEESTLYVILLAAFSVILHRHSSQEDILVGSPTSARNRAEFENIVGCFFNALVLRINFTDDLTFKDFLRQVRKTVLGALDHQDFPSHFIAERLQPTRDLSRPPLFQATFIFQKPHRFEEAASIFNEGESGVNVGGLWMKVFPLEKKQVRSDLELEMIEAGGSLHAWLSYNADLFDASTIHRMAGHFETLLEGIISGPNRRLSDLPLLKGAELRQVLTECNRTQKDFTCDRCAHELFEIQVERTPHAIAVSCGNDRLTYLELNRRANQLAHYLIAQGVGPDVIVGICMERSVEMLIGLLGILKAGGAYLPLDPIHPQARIDLIINNAQATLLLTHRHLIERAPASVIKLICLDSDSSDSAVIANESPENPAASVMLGNLAYVIYTSGSTGEPKGVMIEHGSLVNYAEAAADEYGLGSHDCVLQFASISFDTSAEEIYPCLIRGGTLVLRDDSMLASPSVFLQKARSMELTVLDLPTAYWHELMANMAAEEWHSVDRLRLVIIGGERALPERLATWQKYVGERIQLINTYGPTEATIVSTLCELSPSLAGGSLSEVPIGRPVANAQTYVLDKYLRPVPIGVVGELHIGGVGLSRCYVNLPDRTAEKFIPHPFSDRPGLRLYKTGDLARRLADGNLEFVGRADHQVKVRGFRIELGEIEATLRQHPAINETVVIAREDVPGSKLLVAYMTTCGERPSVGQLRNFLKERLPEFMVPSAFVMLEAMPVTPSGKVDRRALPVPEMSRRDMEEAFVAPRTPEEEMIAGVCAELLGLKSLGVDDNLFHLGCHSLLATRIIARLREAFQIELPLVSLFENPTVAGLAAAVKDALSSEQRLEIAPIRPVPRDRDLPLSFAQERLWFLCKLDPNNTSYYIPRAIRITGPLDVGVLERTFTELVRQHEILRTTFPLVNGRPIQFIHPPPPFVVPVIDLRELPEDERDARVGQVILEQGQHPFDLERDMMLRVVVLRLAELDYVMVLTEHHLVHDGWTQGVLVRDFLEVYAAFASGKESPLPEPVLQYADFAYWQRQWLQGNVLETQLAYWTEQLAGAPSFLELPVDRPRPPVQSFRGAEQTLVIDQEFAKLLRAVSRQEGVTLFMTMFAAFNALLYRYTFREEILVGSGIANRRWSEIEGLLGMIINTLVLRTDLSGNPTFRELLQRVRAVCLQAYAHQDLPFEKVVEKLKPERSLSYNPIFQVMFSFMDAPTRELELPGLMLSVMNAHNRSAKFDLNVVIIPHTEQLIGQASDAEPSEIIVLWEYNTDIFDAPTIARMLGHFHNLLRAVVTDLAQPLSELPLLTEAERRQLLIEWNDAGATYSQDKSIHQLFELQVEREPNSVAVASEDLQLTYLELNQRANQLARYLRRLGIESEELTGICMDRSADMIIAILAVLKAGGAYVPLDPAYPKDRLAFMLEDSQILFLLTKQDLLDRIEQLPAQVIRLDADWKAISRESTENLNAGVVLDNAAYVIYTSGSTGRPKGVLITHNQVTRLFAATWPWFDFDEQDIWTLFHSYAFDFSVWEIWGALLYGGRLVVVPYWVSRRPESFYELLCRNQVTILNQTPSAFRQLSQVAQARTADSRLGLRQIIFGGEALELQSLEGWAHKYGDVQLVNMYGITETTVHVTHRLLRVEDISQCRVSVIGRPIPDLQVYILDGNQQPVPIGVAGELYVGGAGVARGYLKRAELTAERIVPDPFSKRGGRLYRSGDLARYREDGDIEYLGRIDKQVKVRGFRIEPGEIESALLQHRGVSEAVVVAREEAPGDKRLVSYLVAKPGWDISVGELRNHLQAKLPEYMIPSAFVRLEALPLTSNGKLDWQALPLPDQITAEMLKDYVAPNSDVERVLVGMWGEVLGIERVGIHNDFFEMGGHSLLATQLISRLRDAFEIELSLRSLFEAPTVARFAATVLEKHKDRVMIEQTAELLLNVARLSDEEVETMLSDEMT